MTGLVIIYAWIAPIYPCASEHNQFTRPIMNISQFNNEETDITFSIFSPGRGQRFVSRGFNHEFFDHVFCPIRYKL